MNMKRKSTVICCVICNLMSIVCTTPLKGEVSIDTASIDYLQAYRLVYVPANAKITDKMVLYTVESSLKGITPEKISLTIQAETRQVSIAVNKSGSFTLPLSKEMIAQNPKIVSNQPKGTLSLHCFVIQMCVALGEDGALTYRDLMEPIVMSRAIEAIIDGKHKVSYPENVSFRLGEIGSGKVILQGMDRMEIDVDRKIGLFDMPFSGQLLQENPIIQFPKGSQFLYYVEDCGMPGTRLSGRLVRF